MVNGRTERIISSNSSAITDTRSIENIDITYIRLTMRRMSFVLLPNW